LGKAAKALKGIILYNLPPRTDDMANSMYRAMASAQVESRQRLDPLPRPRHLPVETLRLALRRPEIKIKQIQHSFY
jgi:hypothetical protein